MKEKDFEVVKDGMTQAVHDFVGDTEQSDDLTMMAIKLKE
jgi:hypothetical protein